MIFLFCIFLIFAAPVIYIIWCILRIRKLSRLTLGAITIICMLTGVVFSILATYIDINNLPAGVRCGNPSLGFAFLGLAFTVIIIPVTGIVFFAIDYFNSRKIIAA